MDSAHRIPHAFSRRFLGAAYLIGFALGGFFDGILLHQILQWHHVLSLVESEALRSLRAQIFADGVFHALMYAIAAIGLLMLYRSRREFTGVQADRTLLAASLVGFGVWHVVDAVLFHWILELHHIRVDTSNPLAWDIVWLAVFGILPIVAGALMKKRYPRRGSAAGTAAGIAAATLLAGTWAALPPSGAEQPQSVTVVLRPDVRAGEFLASLQGTEARVLWSDRAGAVWVLTTAKDISGFRYYAHGALYVSGSLLPAGCSAWIKT